MAFRHLGLGVGVALAAAPMASHSAESTPPALALPPACQSQGTVTAAMPFPTGQMSDVTVARSVIPALQRGLAAKKLAAPACLRAVMQTNTGPLIMGGENTDAFARVVSSADGKGAFGAYLAKGEGDGAPYALIVMRSETIMAATRFYAGIPTDRVLGADLAASLSENGYLIAMRRTGQMVEGVEMEEVGFGFPPPGGGMPPEPATGMRPDGTSVSVGPQMNMSPESRPFVTFGSGPVVHKPSNLGCPQTLSNGAIMLADIQADAQHIQCSYRDGPGTAYQAGARPYTLMIAKDPGTLAEIIADLSAGARKALSIAATIPPPLALGPAPAPQAGVFWRLTGGGVTGLWLGRKGDWVVRLQVEYDARLESEAKMRSLAQEIYAAVYKP